MAKKKTQTKKNTKKRNNTIWRAKGQIQSALRQNDTANFVMRFTHSFTLNNHTFTAVWPVDLAGEQTVGNVYAVNIYQLLARADQFKLFSQMYDQFKVNGVFCTLTVANATLNTANQVKTFDVYTAWDRNGLDDYNLLLSKVAGEGTNKPADYVTINMGKGISQYSSVKKMQLNTYQRWSQNRSLYPTDMEEKSCYLATSNLLDWSSGWDTSKAAYTIDQSILSATPDQYILLNKENPTFLTQSQSCKWKPTLLVGAFKTDVVGNSTDAFSGIGDNQSINFSVEFKVPMTFRGLKGGQYV